MVYEAGPTGFGLARHFRAAGIDCVIAAPSKLLRAPGDRIKTDRRDAKILANMLAIGEVVEVRIPDPEQEALRDLSRARHVASVDLAHAKQRVNAILLRHAILFPGGKSRWTREHLAWLHQQHFEDPALEFAYQESLAQEDSMAVRLKRSDKEVARVAADCRYTEVVNALACLRGISTVGAFGLATEIGDWTRFTGASIGAYLGLVPSEHSSGETRTQGSITKAGNTHAGTCSSRPRPCTSAPTAGPGSWRCASLSWCPRPPRPAPGRATSACMPALRPSRNATRCP
ncbi:IS110 family transposase [Paeniglutamicibacter sp. R2-26]|uniref:IS110 family transposase n=1 Tax=Paeniglutamicibacter sp. R2-26 TaxID=3144417 RepID=UPI003EE74004